MGYTYGGAQRRRHPVDRFFSLRIAMLGALMAQVLDRALLEAVLERHDGDVSPPLARRVSTARARTPRELELEDRVATAGSYPPRIATSSPWPRDTAP